jgi:hypothetical protein
MGRRFELRTNHCGLEHFFGKTTLNARQTRWLEFLSEYDFEIKHIKEKKTRWSMHLVKEFMKCIFFLSTCTRHI